VEPVTILTRLIFCSALPAHLARPIPQRSSQFSRPTFFSRSFFWTASGQFLRPAASWLLSRFRPYTIGFPPIKQENGERKRRKFSYVLSMNSIMIIGFVGADPEQRQARNNGSKFTVLSVATQRSRKNTEDEWVSKVEWHRVAIIEIRPSFKRNTTIAMPIRGLLQARGPSHMGHSQSWHNLTAMPTSGHLVLLLRLQRPQGFRDFH
jgi:hypothetical protein